MFTEWCVNDYRREHNAFGGVGYYRIVKPFQFLTDDYEVTVCGNDYLKWGKTPEEIWSYAAEHFDLVITKHIDNGLAASNLLAIMKHFGVPVLVDLDDNYLNVRPSNPAHEHYKPGQIKRYALSALMMLADGLVVSTEPLKAELKEMNPNIDVLPNFNDIEDWKYQLRDRSSEGKVIIGYAGSITHNDDLELIIEPLIRVLKKHPQAHFELLGAMHADEWEKFKAKFGDVGDRLSMYYGTPAWEGYPQLLAETGWDIGLAPLIDDEFNRSKSHIKWMEYAMYKIPCVASKVYPYHMDIGDLKTIESGETGFLCETSDEWEKTLSELVEKKELRKAVGTKAYEYVKQNWQWKQHKDKWVTILNKYFDGIQR